MKHICLCFSCSVRIIISNSTWPLVYKWHFLRGGEFACSCGAVHAFIVRCCFWNSFENFPFKMQLTQHKHESLYAAISMARFARVWAHAQTLTRINMCTHTYFCCRILFFFLFLCCLRLFLYPLRLFLRSRFSISLSFFRSLPLSHYINKLPINRLCRPILV